MKMTSSITNNAILFKRFFYSVVIPKESDIQYIFHDYKSESGIPLALEVKSDKVRIESHVGFIGTLVYYLQASIAHFLFRVPMYGHSHFSSAPTVIYFAKDIKTFLEELQKNGYVIDDKIRQFQEISNKPFPQALIPGTKAWEKDKFWLVTIVFLFFEYFIVRAVFDEGISWKTFIIFIFASIFLLLICRGMYQGLKKMKKIKT